MLSWTRTKHFVLGCLLCCMVVVFSAPVGAVETVNINTASAEELVALPSVGPVIAQRIVDYREDEPFSSVEEIQEVKGIGEKTFEQIKEVIEVN